MTNTAQCSKEDYPQTLACVRSLLQNNTEWKDRYTNYITKLNDNALMRFKIAVKHFNVPAPFHLHMSMSTAVNECSSVKTIFELRFHGQSAAIIKVDNNQDKSVYIAVKAPQSIINALNAAKMTEEAERLAKYHSICYKDNNIIDWLDWHGEEARDLRKIYLDLESIFSSSPKVKETLGYPEHDMECELLKNYSQKSSTGKEILNIQPVMMGETNARFQMPAPIKASEAKKGINFIKYSGQYGGGIDILARVGSGKGTKLAVLELKDSYTKNEPAEKVMHQAVAYAAFLRELLRSECGENWWKFFGFGGNIPKKLEIKAIVVMPDYPNADTSFGGAELPIGNDVLKLGYIYRADDPANQKICI